jgi:hypothetical protein
VSEELAKRLRESCKLDASELVTYADWRPHVLIFRNFEAVGNIEIWLYGDEVSDARVTTLISLGTATARPGYNLLSMPHQIERLLQNLQDPRTKGRAIDAINAITPAPTWTVLDRLQRAQAPDWTARSSEEIAGLLIDAGRPALPEAIQCFGEDNPLPAVDLDRVANGLSSLHRAGQISAGDFKNYSVFARAYLRDLSVPAYGRSPRDVLPQLTEHCLQWYRVLRCLSGVE